MRKNTEFLKYPNNRIKLGLRDKFFFARIAMIPIGIILWGIYKGLDFFFGIDISETPELALVCMFVIVLIVCLTFSFFSDKNIKNQIYGNKKAKEKDPWEQI